MNRSFGWAEGERWLVVYGNEELLFTAIKNIVINACKYSDSKQAEVRLLVKDLNIFIIIKDDGKGIPEDDIPNIFEPFYRVNESRATEGFGLGLSLANRIIKLHNGEIKVKSELEKGTEFSILLRSVIQGNF